MENKLRECPFCGGKVKFRKLGATSWITVEHKGRANKCAALTFKAELSREEMAALWNTRASDNRKCGDCVHWRQELDDPDRKVGMCIKTDTPREAGFDCADFTKRGEK